MQEFATLEMAVKRKRKKGGHTANNLAAEKFEVATLYNDLSIEGFFVTTGRRAKNSSKSKIKSDSVEALGSGSGGRPLTQSQLLANFQASYQSAILNPTALCAMRHNCLYMKQDSHLIWL